VRARTAIHAFAAGANLRMKTKAAILNELNAPLIVDEIEVPTLDCGQVLVQIHCSGICGAQLGEIAGVKGPDKFLPHLLGHEGGAVVSEVGPGVTQVKPGDHVVLHWRKGAGIQARPAQYRWKGRTVNSGWVTTFSELSVVSENRVTPIAKDVPFEIAALMGCAVTTGLGLINNDAQVKIGQSVAVLGVGGVGLNVVQGAALAGADSIIAIDLYDHKLDLARKFGATHAINSNQTDWSQQLSSIVGTAGVDVFVENTGQARLIELAYKLTAPQGRTILVGVPRHDQDISIHSLPLHFGKVLTGCEGGHTYPTADIPRYLRLYQKGKLRLDGQITHRFPLDKVNTALDTVRKGEAGRCLITMS
jgi:S-(hydroxymethyl)glutathione dehydrogenase/alcohol dehydrogenase